MTVLTPGTVVDIDTAKKRPPPRPQPARPRVTGQKEPSRAQVVVSAPAAVRRMKDIVWTAVISITLATLALVVGALDVFFAVNLVPLVEGAGLASIAFGLAGLSDKVDSYFSRRQ